MKDKQMYKELTKFANSHTLAKDVDILVTSYSTTIEAKEGCFARYEDVCLLSDIIRGATHYLMWKRRNSHE